MSDLNSPIDPIHGACQEAREWVNTVVDIAKERVERWDIRPCPPDWYGE